MANKIWFLPKKPNEKRILFHAINHVGLGHLNRLIAVAQLLKAGIPDLQVLFLIEGGQEFIEPTGFPWILIPGHASESESCEHIVRMVLNIFHPNLVIYDTILREHICRPVREVRAKQVLMGNVGGLLRDYIRGNLSGANEVDLLFILQGREEVGSSDQALIAQYSGKKMYVGPLVRRKNQVSVDCLRQKLDLTSGESVILCTLGGGGYDLARELLRNLLAARVQILDRYPQAKFILISGPHFNGELPEADESVCYTSRFEPFLTDYLNIASSVVCMAGYNTINEVVAFGVPAICVPTSEADDQVGSGGMSEYAQRFPTITLSSTDTNELAHKVIDALAKERDHSTMQEFWRRADGAAQSIVHEIKRVLDNTV